MMQAFILIPVGFAKGIVFGFLSIFFILIASQVINLILYGVIRFVGEPYRKANNFSFWFHFFILLAVFSFISHIPLI